MLWSAPRAPSLLVTATVLIAVVLVITFWQLPKIHDPLSPWLHSSSSHPQFAEDTHDQDIDNDIHPVLRLHLAAQRAHAAFEARQSKTFSEAIRSYAQRNNNTRPPAGFSKWIALAQSCNSAVIDDFDTLTTQLLPFSTHPLNGSAPASHLWQARVARLCVRAGEVHFEGFNEQWTEDALKALVGDFAEHLPDVCVYVNALDEARVVPLPLAGRARDEAVQEHDRDGLALYDTRGHASIWSEAGLPCLFAERGRSFRKASAPPSASASASASAESAAKDIGKRRRTSLFAESFETVTDLCRYTRNTLAYGLLEAPETASFTHDPVPILSNAKPSTFGDILFPSLWRYEHLGGVRAAQAAAADKGETPPDDAVPDDTQWEQKSKTLYWRGSTTGGHVRPGGPVLHRQQLIGHIHALREEQEREEARFATDAYSNRTDAPGMIRPDVAFTQTVQCDDDETACAAATSGLPTSDRAPASAAHAHRLLLDVDGNGLSGRLYDLLLSRGAVLRFTMLREWHDDRLRPWLHFVPLRPGAPEMRALLEYFATEEGDRVARAIGEAGREWAERALRREDMRLYFLRILMEASGEREHVDVDVYEHDGDGEGTSSVAPRPTSLAPWAKPPDVR